MQLQWFILLTLFAHNSWAYSLYDEINGMWYYVIWKVDRFITSIFFTYKRQLTPKASDAISAVVKLISELARLVTQFSTISQYKITITITLGHTEMEGLFSQSYFRNTMQAIFKTMKNSLSSKIECYNKSVKELSSACPYKMLNKVLRCSISLDPFVKLADG